MPVSTFIAPELMCLMANCIYQVSQGQVVSNYQGMCLRKDGSGVSVAVTGFPIRNAAREVVAITAMLRDITERKRLEAVLHDSETRLRAMAEDRVQFLAHHDAVTELPNRSHLEDRLDNALAGARRREEKVALLFLNLDRFKIINDSFGHSFGDIVLRDLAKRLKHCVREPDTVARIGGDEFVVILNGVMVVADAITAAQRMIDATDDMRQSLNVAEQNYRGESDGFEMKTCLGHLRSFLEQLAPHRVEYDTDDRRKLQALDPTSHSDRAGSQCQQPSSGLDRSNWAWMTPDTPNNSETYAK